MIKSALDEEHESAPITWKPSRSICVLLAEDNAINQKLVRRILEARGHSVLLANNGEEAFSCLQDKRQGAIDVVLMDCHMPEVDGFACTASIRASCDDHINRIPVIALTADAMSGDRERCLQSGMNEYISKPININRLIYLVEKYGKATEP